MASSSEVLSEFSNRVSDVAPIGVDEHGARVARAVKLMQEAGLAAVYLHAGSNLLYFTGTRWNPSERLMGVLLTANGTLDYIGPAFEEGTIHNFKLLDGDLHCWEEHESPFALLGKVLERRGITRGRLGLDESLPFFLAEQIRIENPKFDVVNAMPITAGRRMCKSDAEIGLLQRAKDITLDVHKAVGRILRPGITAKEVIDFINEAHIRSGIASGSYFCIVLFGEDTQYPHGVPAPRPLRENDVVLVDTGCQLHGYISDITRTYVYGEPTARQQEIWDLEKAAQQAAFDAAQPGATCASVDAAARKVLEAAGLGPDYKLPGLPHRTGHGTGLDIHEHPYLVRGNTTPLQKGMVCSIEPMICLPGEFGIRHEDHFYMTETGPRWFTTPMQSIGEFSV